MNELSRCNIRVAACAGHEQQRDDFISPCHLVQLLRLVCMATMTVASHHRTRHGGRRCFAAARRAWGRATAAAVIVVLFAVAIAAQSTVVDGERRLAEKWPAQGVLDSPTLLSSNVARVASPSSSSVGGGALLSAVFIDKPCATVLRLPRGADARDLEIADGDMVRVVKPDEGDSSAAFGARRGAAAQQQLLPPHPEEIVVVQRVSADGGHLVVRRFVSAHRACMQTRLFFFLASP